jgi:hypothetical protein
MNIEDTPVENLEVKKQQTSFQSKVESKEFCEKLTEEFSNDKVWRSSKVLAEKLNVDVVELDEFLRKQTAVCCKASKDEGVFLYALVKRVEQEKEKTETAARSLVSEEDRYALAYLHSCHQLFDSALKKYALKIHERNPESFTQLMSAKSKMEAGLVLFAQKIKADLNKLPDF